MLTKRSERGLEGQKVIPNFPSPWELQIENSWILPFHATTDIPEFQFSNREYQRSDLEGLGMAMIISYKNSNAGPYDELLFATPCQSPTVPGEFLPTYRIPLIYVSTEESVRNGRKNWGIRKELANFSWNHTTGFLHRKTSLIVTDRLSGKIFLTSRSFDHHFVCDIGKVLFDGSFVTLSLPLLPLVISWIGRLCPIIAERKIDEDGNVIGKSWVLTRLGGSGWTRFTFAFVNSVIGNIKICFGVHTRGKLLFPVPREITDAGKH
jgi:hypothetical protein